MALATVGSGAGRLPPIEIADGAGYTPDQFHIASHYRSDVGRILVPRGTCLDRIEKLALDIHRCYKGEEVHIICTLKGAGLFFAELLKALRRIHEYTEQCHPAYIEHYVRLSSYKNTESTGTVSVDVREWDVIRGQHCLIVEDLVDTGRTLTTFTGILQDFAPRSLRVAALLEKRTARNATHFVADFVGFSVPDEFIVGFSIDYNEMFRDLAHVCVIAPSGVERYARRGA